MIQNIDTVQQGLDRLTSELDKEGIKILLETLLQKQFEVQEEFIQLANARSIDLSEGVWLDYIGEIFNVPRGGLSDELYREALRFKIAVNNANGTPNIIISLIKEFTQSLSVELRDSGIAFATLYFDGSENTSAEVYNLLKSIKPAGTRWVLHSDVFRNAFRLAYESSVLDLEALDVTLDGVVFENLLVTLNGEDFEPLFITTDQMLEYYEPSLGNNSWYYEEPPFLQITTDGVNFEPLVLNTGLPEERLRVVVPYLDDYIPDNILPLTWEVWENSKNALPV